MIDEAGIPKLDRQFKFANFVQALEFTNALGDLARIRGPSPPSDHRMGPRQRNLVDAQNPQPAPQRLHHGRQDGPVVRRARGGGGVRTESAAYANSGRNLTTSWQTPASGLRATSRGRPIRDTPELYGSGRLSFQIPAIRCSWAGWYRQERGGLAYTLVYRGVGRIYAINFGHPHANPSNKEQVGRKHKHYWTEEYAADMAYNPTDITAPWHWPLTVWQQFCAEARIEHRGVMHSPD